MANSDDLSPSTSTDERAPRFPARGPISMRDDFSGSIIRHYPPRMPRANFSSVRRPQQYLVPPGHELVTRRELTAGERVIEPHTGSEWVAVVEDGQLVLAPLTGGSFRLLATDPWADSAVIRVTEK